jgi:AraC family transcriptional regulator, positive regulator of tynA and feaB
VPGRLHKWTLLVPSSRLPARPPSGLLDPAAAALLTALLGTTLASAGSLDARLGRPVADAAVDLLAGALGPPPDDDPAWSRVAAYVERNLRDPALTPSAVAAGAYLSLRSLYALFAARGQTPAGYVRRLRLEGAHRELARRGTAGTVAQVAHAWGFRDQATFGRGFRAAFGRTPDEVRRGSYEVRPTSSRSKKVTETPPVASSRTPSPAAAHSGVPIAAAIASADSKSSSATR